MSKICRGGARTGLQILGDIIVIIGCPILNCMILYNVCNDKDKYYAILWASVEIIVGDWIWQS